MNKKTAPSIAAKSSCVQQLTTLSHRKVSENAVNFQDSQGEKPTPQLILNQRQGIHENLSQQSEKGATRMMIARAVGIERANVCRRIAELREEGRIWTCGRHLCKITGIRAEYLTCNPHTAFEYYLNATASTWAALPTEDERHEMQDSIWQYAIQGGEVNELFDFHTKVAREKWDEVKAIIDKEVRQ